MEIASGEVISDAEKERALEALEKLCIEERISLGQEHAKQTAKAVFHEAVNASAKNLANSLASESGQIARRTLSKLLRKHHEYPSVETIVIEAVEPVTRFAALDAVRKWSLAKAMPEAEAAAIKTLNDGLAPGIQPVLKSAVLAGLRVLLNGASADGTELTKEERSKILDDYLHAEARKAAVESIEQAMTADLLRQVQMAAEKAIADVAAQATDAVARDEALKAAEAVAFSTSKEEIARLILAEAQRRAAKLTREFLQEEAPKQEENVRAQYCQEQALRLAKEAVQEVIDEVADPQVADLEINKALELASAASTAVAREYSGAYEFTTDAGGMAPQTLVILGVQILVGCVLIWYFFLGGYDILKPSFRYILPPPVFRAIYPVTPTSGKTAPAGTVDDLTDDATPIDDEINPGDPTKDSTKDPGTGTAPGAGPVNESGSSSSPEPHLASPEASNKAHDPASSPEMLSPEPGADPAAPSRNSSLVSPANNETLPESKAAPDSTPNLKENEKAK